VTAPDKVKYVLVSQVSSCPSQPRLDGFVLRRASDPKKADGAQTVMSHAGLVGLVQARARHV
jgi:hypothetical protein